MSAQVKATMVADIHGPGGDIPGAFAYRGDPPVAMLVRCPCGCGDVWRFKFRHATAGRPSWEWSGVLDRPTLNPSLHMLEGDPDAPENEHAKRREDFKMRTHWHGWLRAGEFVSV